MASVIVSIVITVLQLPEAKVGLALNMVLIVLLIFVRPFRALAA